MALTGGAIQAMYDGDTGNPLCQAPTLQAIHIKKINAQGGNATTDRYR